MLVLCCASIVTLTSIIGCIECWSSFSIMNDSVNIKSCSYCNDVGQGQRRNESFSKTRKTTRALPSMILSIFIAFFPKCPVCWAVFMSMFGSLGLAQLPYMGWILPVLLLFLGIHLFILYRKSAQQGYLPFLLSMAGAIIILCGRSFFPLEKWLLITGMLLVASGSFMNSFFYFNPPSLSKQKINP
jgi:mercuric ion transport protein